MSGFVCIFERSGAEVDPRELARLAAPLEGPGAELGTFCRGPVGIAVRRRGGKGAGRRHGPRVDPTSGAVIGVAGRIAPIAGGGETGPAAGGGKSDPILDDEWLAGRCGAFAAVAADRAGTGVEIVRDHLGSIDACYALDGDRLLAASEPAALLRHPAVSGEIDEASAARFLGFRFGHSERSFFRGIRRLAPGHRLRVTASGTRSERYWRFRARDAARGRTPEEIAGEFRSRLGQAVAAEVAGLEPSQVALSLSGGLDSPAIAALAPPAIQAFSWTFDEHPDADERNRVEAVARHLGLAVDWIPGDGLHPLSGDFAERFVDPSSPYVNPFARLKSRLYAAARAAGCERVLVGDGGDAVYAAQAYWLRDLLASGRPAALAGLASTLRRAARGDRFARRALRLVLPLGGPAGLLRRRRAPWLTAAARALLPEEGGSPTLPPESRGASRIEATAGVKHSEQEIEEQRLFARCGVERANPFWSWPLLEMAAQLPAYWHHRAGRSKVLTRAAFRGLLPEAVLEGERSGLLGGVFLRGIDERRDEIRRRVFRRPRSDWPRYVRREWLEPHLSATRSLVFGHTILWRVICYELWVRRLIGGG